MAVVSPGLLVTVPKRSKDAHRRFELGLGEWTESPCKMAVVSPGLLVTVPKRSKDAHRRFELGLGEWTESSEDEKENDPPAPRKKLKLTLEKPKERWHFLTEVAESRRSSTKVRCKEHF